MKVATYVEGVLEVIKSYFLLALVFLVPLFFLPITQEFFVTNKLYLVSFGVLVLVLLSTIEFAITRKAVLGRNTFDSGVLFFVIAVGLSVLFSSPNKVSALLNPNFGLVAMVALGLLYYYLSRLSHRGGQTVNLQKAFDALTLSATMVAILTIIFFFNPFKTVNLPATLQFLKLSTFTPLGGLLDLVTFLGFFVALSVARIISKRHLVDSPRSINTVAPTIAVLLVTGVAFALSLYSLLLPVLSKTGGLTLPPFSISWYAAVEVLKQPMTALFGVGLDNYASIFAKVKDASYNQTALWQVQTFNFSRSTFLHIFSETGMFGFVAFMLLIVTLVKEMVRPNQSGGTVLENILPVGYLLVVMFLLPPSFITFFLLFVSVAFLSQRTRSEAYTSGMDLSSLFPIYAVSLVVMVMVLGGSAYLLGRTYISEYLYKMGLNGVLKNDLGQYYYNQRDSIVLNPYNETHRINFSQTNLLVANNTILKANGGKQQLSDQDRLTITNAIQAAITEAKAVALLNPQKAGSWENLAIIYRNVLNVAQGADVWTIASYQRAIILDPQNPIYRLQLGGVYYSLQNFEEAIRMFEQSAGLKPDWANAHYNVAWAAFQKGDYARAVSEMQSALSLLDSKRDAADYQKAMSELEQFKAKLPKTESATPSAELQPKQLSLPTPPIATVSPKLKLPTGAGPESR